MTAPPPAPPGKKVMLPGKNYRKERSSGAREKENRIC
jgi:hypothetical protein